MALEVFADLGSATVTSGGTTAPASGTSQSWTLSGSTLPACSSSTTPPTHFYGRDPALPGELFEFTACAGTSATVTRGVLGTTTAAHASGFTAEQVAGTPILGAVPQTYNVRSAVYGAAGDGSTDDTTAIQAALTACRTAGGGVVYIPEGVYIISQSLQIGTGTTLAGPGMGAATIRAKASFSPTQVGSNTGAVMVTTFGATTASHIRITGLTFDGNDTNIPSVPVYADAPESAPVSMWAASALTVDNIEVINALGYSIYLLNCADAEVRDCRVLAGATNTHGWVQQDGIHLTQCTQTRVIGNDVDTGTGAAGDDGIALQSFATGTPCLDIVIASNTVRAAQRGIALVLAGGTITNVAISGNVVWTTAFSGLILDITSSSGITSGVTITGNTFANVGTAGSGAGIALHSQNAGGGTGAGWKDVVIAGNNFVGCVVPTGYGIYCGQGSGLSINDNNFDSWGVLTGIQVGDNPGTSLPVTDFQVSGNTINMSSTTATGGAGIGVFDSRDGIIQGNTVVGVTGGGSVGIAIVGVSGTNLCTGIVIDSNRVTGWDNGYQEISSGASPDSITVTGNNLLGCTSPVTLLGGHDTLGSNLGAGIGRTTLLTAFSSGTGTTAQTVTGMSLTLEPGSYQVSAWVPMNTHGTLGGTQKLAWTFGGTASSGYARWTITAAASSTTAAGNVITTASAVSPAMVSTGLIGEFSGHVAVTVAGTLQLTITSGTSGDEATIPAGSWIDVQPAAV